MSTHPPQPQNAERTARTGASRGRESTGPNERAALAEGAVSVERAKDPERTVDSERAEHNEWTEHRERADSTVMNERAVPAESTEPLEREVLKRIIACSCGDRSRPHINHRIKIPCWTYIGSTRHDIDRDGLVLDA